MSNAAAIGKLYRIAAAAKILDVSERHVRNLINEGEILVIRCGVDARADRIEELELQRFIMQRRTNRGIRAGEECLSINVVKSGGLNSRSRAKRLDEVLKQRKKETH